MLNLDNMLAWVDDLETDRLIAAAPEGTWMLDADRRDPAQIRFQLDGLTQENEESLRRRLQETQPCTREAHRLANILGEQLFPIGEAFTREAAEVAIDMISIGDVDLSMESVLDENGYARVSRVGEYQVLRKETASGRFEISLTPLWLAITFTPKGRRTAQMLLRLVLTSGDHSENANMLFWPELVERNFHTLAVQAAMVVTDLFVAEGRDIQKPARSVRRSRPSAAIQLAA